MLFRSESDTEFDRWSLRALTALKLPIIELCEGSVFPSLPSGMGLPSLLWLWESRRTLGFMATWMVSELSRCSEGEDCADTFERTAEVSPLGWRGEFEDVVGLLVEMFMGPRFGILDIVLLALGNASFPNAFRASSDVGANENFICVPDRGK